MAIKPGMSLRHARDDRTKNLRGAWEAFISAADGFTRTQTEGLFETLRLAVCALVTDDAARLSRWGANDERVYASSARLMNLYRETIALYESQKSNMTAFSVRSILEGITAVLYSRLKPFDESAGIGNNAGSGSGDAPSASAFAESEADLGADSAEYPAETPPDNPVTLEKRMIYEKAAVYAAQQIVAQARRYMAQALPGGEGAVAAARRVFLQQEIAHTGISGLLTPVYEAVNENMLRDFYAYYRDGLRFCLANLNDLQQRKAFRYYYEAMEGELEVLGSIVKIQAAALEFAVGHHPVTLREKDTVFRILSLIREGYQRFGGDVMDIRQALGEAEPAEHPSSETGGRSYESFVQALQRVMDAYGRQAMPEEALALSKEKKAAFLTALDKDTEGLFKHIALMYTKAVYRFQRIVSEELLLADEMTATFEKLYREWPEGESPPEGTAEPEILKGIAETLEIKIESLKENVNAFNQESIEKINEFAAERREAEEDDLDKACNAVRMHWLTEMSGTDGAEAEAFLESCLTLEELAGHWQYCEKREAEYGAKIEKKLLSFKRETLLYEVSTYEEILIYSAPRLRESAWPPAAQAAALLDETLKTLEVLLKKNNIYVIRPEPHETFNGLEHEVLMAEKQEGFNKGEIIKPINSGFKQKDTIILRANVIAAK